MATDTLPERLSFQTSPAQYRHWGLSIEGDLATLRMDVDGDAGLHDGYELKLNSYDLGVDIELADAITRLRFEHPEVRCLVLTGNLDRVFCAGANILMLRSSAHAFKVNFCKYTNETRLGIEDASEHSGLKTLAALNGTASGGGYELALACDRILLVDDRNSAVSFPEVPLLGVLPGTGGLTRITDKRKLRRDHTDVFSTLAEGIKGKRAVQWNLVDAIAPLSTWDEKVQSEARELADSVPQRAEQGIEWTTIEAQETEEGLQYEYVTLKLNASERTAELTIQAPESCPATADEALAEGANWWILKAFRELDDALLNLRMNERDIALVLLRAVGSLATLRATDPLLAGDGNWFTQEVRGFVRRTLKRVDVSSKSFFAVLDAGTAFLGTFLELALACDRTYVLNDPEVEVHLGATCVNGGLYPMGNGLSRLQTRFLGDPEAVTAVLTQEPPLDAETADELGLATFAPDEIDWEDELRLATEERASFSPDALTGMESNLRFAGPETMETKIFGRLSAWQNWIFQRPNAVGELGALTCYGTPQRPKFNIERT
ncbi:benzoyl-CoA-dihydrodiol lyase [Candidatus Woesearchaeota archaeon]|nr:benzoyl-CoA-dihydrodiol lyase [Candidatus Woesearchaeota archaeon]MDP6740424.1 2,3-epoxybenzoyl-CoA dihydrolase [Planctomycetota bacterium]MDP6938813.1 2,3-epoxybenzoyl-CoA dihydrolase [Planctomycetota bacterium]